ncbi:DUF2520 domain-containing protein [bacterium]|nr:DUF2520 domain-containing protein [candidate division CSSED10-310 bacterium]
MEKTGSQLTIGIDGTGSQLTIGIIGLGRLGSVLADRLIVAGYPVLAAMDTCPDRLPEFNSLFRHDVSDDPHELASCRILFICVPDRSIAHVAEQVVDREWAGQNCVLVHTAGSHGIGIFPAAVRDRYRTGSCHPLMAFPADPRRALPFRDVGFCLDGPEPVRVILNRIVSDLGGFPITIPDDSRALYHAAAVIASNFTVYLEALAANLLSTAGLNPETARHAVNGLMRSVRNNVVGLPLEKALSGPVVRNDWNTVQLHIDTLAQTDPATAALYRTLSSALAAYLGKDALPSRENSGNVPSDIYSEDYHDE